MTLIVRSCVTFSIQRNKESNVYCSLLSPYTSISLYVSILLRIRHVYGHLITSNICYFMQCVDHGILLSRLSNHFGITGTVLEWFGSYLSDRTQFVQVNGACSASHVLEFGVPQGSVLGPLLYSMCTSPLGEIARRHQMFYHFYADDTQLYITFRTSFVSDMNLSNAKLVNRVRDWTHGCFPTS